MLLVGVQIAQAVPYIWSGATVLPVTSAGAQVTPAVGSLAGGGQIVAYTVRIAGNDTWALGATVGSGSTFSPPVWVANGPTDPSPGELSVTPRSVRVYRHGSGAVVVWNSSAQDGAVHAPMVGASIYAGGSWSAPTYLERPSGLGPVTFFAGPDGTVFGVGSSYDGSVYLTSFDVAGSWNPFVAVPGASTRGGYNDPVGVASIDGDVWLAYVGGTSAFSVIGRVGGAWTTQSDLATGTPDDYDAYDIAMGTTPSGAEQPVVVFGDTSGTPVGLKYAWRGDGGTWTSTVIVPDLVYTGKVVIGGADDGSVSVIVTDGLVGYALHTASIGGTWTTSPDLATSIPGVPNWWFGTLANNARGDVAYYLPVTNGSASALYLIGIRAGASIVTGPVLLSSEVPGEQQGAVSTSSVLDLDGPNPTAWSSFNDTSASDYGLYWIDAASVFPPTPDPTPIRPTTTTTTSTVAPNVDPVVPTFTG